MGLRKEITRGELVRALGVHVKAGGGYAALNMFGYPSISGRDSSGRPFKLNGETDDNYICLDVEVEETS